MDSDDDAPPAAVPLEPEAPAGFPVPRLDTFGIHKPVPVTLITGFLGAGKSTLVRHILTAEHGRRIAVIVNEFGEELGIERAIVNEPGGGKPTEVTDWLELANGCLCCSMKGELVAGLEGLLQQRDRFDYILIETSGLANPGPVATALWTDAELEAGVTLDGIITVVDARHLPRQLAAAPAEGADGANEAQQQIAYSDVVLLNKTDLESEQGLEAVEAAVVRISPTARQLRTRYSRVDVADILDLQALAGDRLLDGFGCQLSTTQPSGSGPAEGAAAAHSLSGRQREGAAAAADSRTKPDAAHGSAAGSATQGAEPSGSSVGHSHNSHSHHLHADQVTSVSLRLPGDVDLQRVQEWVEGLLWERQPDGADVFRMKGVLAAAGSATQTLLQAVHELYDVTESAAWPADKARISRLVVIGRRLDRASLEAGFRRCAA